MATLPANDAIELDVAGEIVLMPVDAIAIGDRLRPVDEVWAGALGQIMLREGQQTPIEVGQSTNGYHLVAGAHRLIGARLVGIELIEARIVSGSEAHRRQREISENLWRRDLDPLDRAAFIAELVQLKREQAGIKDATRRDMSVPRAVLAEAEQTCDTMSHVYGWTADVADDLGFTKRTIQRDLALYRGLRPSVVATLREHRHPVLKNAAQLQALAKLDPAKQEKVVEGLLAFSRPSAAAPGAVPAKTVSEALARLQGSNSASRTPADKHASAFIGAWNRMGVTERKGALAELARQQLPAGFKIVSGDAASRPSATLMPEKDLAELKDAMSSAFNVFLQLVDGTCVDDDAIASAKGKIQLSLMGLNAGLVPGAPA